MERNEAILAAIEHWKRMRDWALKQPPNDEYSDTAMFKDIGEDSGGKYCPLCQVYYRKDYPYCSGCPIAEKTWLNLCKNTPYDSACSANYIREFVDAANKEIEFLETLTNP